MDGILLIDKPAGMTTRQIDNRLKHVFSTRKIGHAGTLDPFATGLVLIGINDGTKALSLFEFLDKTYVAKLKLGEKTKSADKDTDVIATAPVPALNETLISYRLLQLTGEQLQIPPMYSALKVGGTPLYELARQDLEIERAPRKVVIHELKLLKYDPVAQTIDFEARVSKGTYIRTLAEDIASGLGTVGHLIELRRLRIGRFGLSKAHTLDEVTADTKLYSIPSSCYFLPKVPAGPKIAAKVKNGVPLKIKTKAEIILFVDPADPHKALSFYMRSDGDIFRCRRGISSD